jgi:hypothetical protein
LLKEEKMKTRNWFWVLILISIFIFPTFTFAQRDTLILLGRNTETGSYAVSASNQYAFGTDGDRGTGVVDYSDPGAPLSSDRYPGWAFDVEIKDRLAYIGGLSLEIIDVSDPLEPQAVGTCGNWNHFTFRVHLFGDLALVMHTSIPQYCFLEIIDISNPTNPQILSTNYTPPEPSMYSRMDAWEKGNYVYWVDEAVVYDGGGSENLGRIVVLDIINPTSPVPIVVDTCLPSSPTAIWIKDDYAYVTITNDETNHGGLMVLDVSDPYNIDSVGFFETHYEANNVYIKGSLAYISAHLRLLQGDGVYVVNITDPSNPTLVTYYDTPGTPMDVLVDEPYVLVADYSSLLFLQASFLTPGDVNWDREVNSADIAYLINYLFVNGPEPPNLPLADINCDGQTNSADAVYLINYLFAQGPSPQGGC